MNKKKEEMYKYISSKVKIDFVKTQKLIPRQEREIIQKA